MSTKLIEVQNHLRKTNALQEEQNKLKKDLVKSLLIQEICSTAFDNGSCKAFVALKGTEEKKSYNQHQLNIASFPKDFSLVVTDGKGNKSIHDLEPFEQLEQIQLLNPKRPKS